MSYLRNIVAEDLLRARKVVVLAYITGGWGDRILRLPALQALEHIFGDRLWIVAESYTQQTVFSGFRSNRFCSVQLEQLLVSDRMTELEIRPIWKKIYDAELVIILKDDMRYSTAKVLASIAPRMSIGLIPECDIFLAPNDSVHRVEHGFAIPKHLAPSLEIADFARPRFAPIHHRRARQIRRLVPERAKLLLVHGESKPDKTWPREYFAEVVEAFLTDHANYFVFVLGLENDKFDCGPNGDRVIPIVGVPLGTAFALVGEADAFVGIDSCFLHAADLFGVPGVGLFGPSGPQRFGFRFSPHKHVCTARVSDPMSSICVRDVLEAIESLMLERALY